MVENYPFQEYGLGITSYFRLMKNLIYVLLVISVLVFPILIIYGGHKGYKQDATGIFLKSMLGNMGEAYNQCIFNYIEYVTDHKASCQTGKISKLIYSGLMPYTPAADETNKNDIDFCGDAEIREDVF